MSLFHSDDSALKRALKSGIYHLHAAFFFIRILMLKRKSFVLGLKQKHQSDTKVPSRSRREHPPDAEHLQRPEGDHQPRRHGAGRHPQLLTCLSAVHPAIHAGRHPAARHQRESLHGHQGLPQVRQNHADYI